MPSQGKSMSTRQTMIRRSAAFLAIALLANSHLSAATITQEVTFLTNALGGGNQLAVTGKLDPLAQNLREAKFNQELAMLNVVEGTLTASVTFDVSQGVENAQVVGISILESSFKQQDLEFTYQVPGTQRTISFTSSNVNFSLTAQASNQQLLQVSAINTLSEHYLLEQNSGIAQVGITNRPSKQQSLSEKNVRGSVLDAIPQLGQLNIGVVPDNQMLNGVVVNLSFTLADQQLLYSGVGLPVMLDYQGSLNLLSPVITLNIVPEPSSALLLGACLGSMLLGHRRLG